MQIKETILTYANQHPAQRPGMLSTELFINTEDQHTLNQTVLNKKH